MTRRRCPRTGKRCWPTSLAVILAYSHSPCHTRPYRCPYCRRWHANSQPKRGTVAA